MLYLINLNDTIKRQVAIAPICREMNRTKTGELTGEGPCSWRAEEPFSTPVF